VAIDCWAHARRYFFEAQGENPAAAGRILTRIASAYRLEREWNQQSDLTADGRTALRQAILYSIVVSCQRHGIDPAAYLRDVLSRQPAMTNQDDLTPLLPGHWQPARRDWSSNIHHASSMMIGPRHPTGRIQLTGQGAGRGQRNSPPQNQLP